MTTQGPGRLKAHPTEGGAHAGRLDSQANGLGNQRKGLGDGLGVQAHKPGPELDSQHCQG